MLERFPIVGMLILLSVLSGAIGAAEAQQPSGYWLYVEGTWTAGFLRQPECEAAGTKTGKPYECRAVSAGPAAGGAQQGGWATMQSTQDPGVKWAKDVKECSSATGAEAYVPEPGKVSMLGTPRAIFEFKKCLIGRGHRLE